MANPTSPFLAGILRDAGKSRGLLNQPASGGMNVGDPTGVGSGAVNPPQQPAGPEPPPPLPDEVGGPPAEEPQEEAAITPGQSDFVLPPLMQEFPMDTLADADSQEKVLPARNLSEAFARRYGRPPTDVDFYILHVRGQFEQHMGRPPSKTELVSALQRTYKAREDMPI